MKSSMMRSVVCRAVVVCAAVVVVSLVSAPAIAGNGLGSEASNADAKGAITYHKDVEPLFQANCQSCHRPDGLALGGMIAPMPLTTYQEVRPWARSIARKVKSREMPPWFASPEFHGSFSNERTLSDDQIATVVDWVAAGAPKGDEADAPAPIERAHYDGWTIGKPDLVLDFADGPFWVDDDVRDLNISVKAELITKEMLPEPRWIEAIEFKTGSDVVHHIVASKSAFETEEPGASGLLAGLAPGTEPFALPEGFGRLLVPNTQIYLSMHYNKEPGEGSGRWDRSQVGIKFKPQDEEIRHIAGWHGIGNLDFEIPPNTAKWEVGSSMLFEHEATIFSFMPHMHLRGRYAKYVAYYPNGKQETLLEVPWYDWNWQTNYEFEEPKVVPAGTRLEVTMYFDNTPEREELIRAQGTEINSQRAVRFGGPTSDEMMIGFVDFAYNIPVDSAANTTTFATGAGGR